MLFLVLRYVVSVLPLADNYVEWIFSFCSQIVLNLGLTFILFFAMNKNKKIGSFTDTFYLKRPKKLSSSEIVLILVLPFIVRYASIGVSYFTQIVLLNTGFTTVSGAGTIYSSTGVFLMEILTTAVFPCVCEEVYNRGLLLSALDDKPDGIGKVILMGLMFGLFHQNIQQFLYTFFAGCVFAVVAMRTKSIIPCMYMHFVNNFLAVFFDYCSQKGTFIGGLYDYFYETIFSQFFFIVILSFIGAFVLVVYICQKLMLRNKIEKAIEKPIVFDKEIDFFSLASRNMDDDTMVVEVEQKSTFADVGFLVATIVVTAVSTIMTYIWGMLR